MKTNIKKLTAIILALLLTFCCLSGCGSQSDSAAPGSAEGSGLKIVTTIFPVYDWVMNVLGDNPAGAEVIMLMDNGVDLHSFQPTVEDMMDISSCDLFIYVGGTSDKWVGDILKGADNADITTLNLLDILGDSAMEEELVEGMQGEEEEKAEEGPEYDEHIWLSLKNAAVLADSIEKALEETDPENAETYKANAAAYIEKINALDGEFEATVSASPVKTLLFGDRFPFVYMTSDYGLDYYAAFLGCSAESEASFETVTFLANKVDELSLNSIITLEGSDGKLADTIRKATKTGDQQILTLNSMQAVTAEDLNAGADYLEIMKNNLSVLTEALK